MGPVAAPTGHGGQQAGELGFTLCVVVLLLARWWAGGLGGRGWAADCIRGACLVGAVCSLDAAHPTELGCPLPQDQSFTASAAEVPRDSIYAIGMSGAGTLVATGTTQVGGSTRPSCLCCQPLLLPLPPAHPVRCCCCCRHGQLLLVVQLASS